MRFQPIYDIAEICALKGVVSAVLCPGSRCAPLTIAFTRHKKISSRTFSDERSAGFVALGLSQSTQAPVAIVCTSGSAAYNLAPAVAEAFFSEAPLIVFTADRPMEWIAQHDGQTIYQTEIFGRHVKKSFQLPQDYDHDDSKWAINRIVNDAINLAWQFPRGPVHINAPFREPLYPEKQQDFRYLPNVRIINATEGIPSLADSDKKKIRRTWSQANRTLIIAGQQSDAGTVETIEKAAVTHHLPIVADIVSNLHAIEGAIRHSDLFLGQAPDSVKKTLQPELLITFGRSLVSKNLKLFIRKYKPKQHWHIQPGGTVADPFQSVTDFFQCSVNDFFAFVSSLPVHAEFDAQKQINFENLWSIEQRRVSRTLTASSTEGPVSEIELVANILEALPDGSSLHLANSMSVRYANFYGLGSTKKNVTVFSNRGTSGIDGCTSTAVGHALGSRKATFLITGDLAFFYDRNAFWHNYPIDNLRVILLNNHGGLIFNIIDGPRSIPEAEEFFITRQRLSAQYLSREFDFDHLKLDSRRKLKNVLKDFLEFDGRTKILELETDIQLNRTIFDTLKNSVKKTYES